MSRLQLALVLLLASPVLARAQYAAPPDYLDYQRLLDQYCIRVMAKNQPLDTRFDYKQFYVDEKIWSLGRSERLERIHDQLVRVHPDALSPADRTAWALNTYNFLVLERATLLLLVPGHHFQRYKSVDEMHGPDGGFFDVPVATIDGKDYSLARFERTFVDRDSLPPSPIPPPRTKPIDPRLLFAACSGYVGGGPLPPRAFLGDSLELQLDDAASAALALPRLVALAKEGRTLGGSEFFLDHKLDFGGDVAGVMAFVAKYAPKAVREAIRRNKLASFAGWQAFDRSLNVYEAPKPTPKADPSKS